MTETFDHWDVPLPQAFKHHNLPGGSHECHWLNSYFPLNIVTPWSHFLRPLSPLFFVVTFLHGSLWISLTAPSCLNFSFLFLFQFLAVTVPGPRIRVLLLVAEVPVSLAVTVPGVPYSCCSSCCGSPSFYPESQFCCTRRPSCFSTRHCTRSPSPPPSRAASRSGSSLQSEKRAICLLKYRTHRLRFKILRNNCLPYHLP